MVILVIPKIGSKFTFAEWFFSLLTLAACVKLSLSTNCIEKLGQVFKLAKTKPLYSLYNIGLMLNRNLESIVLKTLQGNLNGLKNLKILALSRNNIKNLNGLDAVGDTLGKGSFLILMTSSWHHHHLWRHQPILRWALDIVQ